MGCGACSQAAGPLCLLLLQHAACEQHAASSMRHATPAQMATDCRLRKGLIVTVVFVMLVARKFQSVSLCGHAVGVTTTSAVSVQRESRKAKEMVRLRS